MSSLFKRGYKASREEKKKQDENRKKNANRIYDFFVSASEDGEPSEADIVFLTEEPVNFYQHTLYDGKNVNKYTCSGKDCPLCAKGERPTAQGAYLVVDRRPFKYTDNTGKERRGKERIKLLKMGMRVVSQLDRISTKRGLMGKIMTTVRIGSGQNTSYTFEDGETCREYNKEHIKELLPEALSENWDGTEDGLMDIIDEQLIMNFPDGADYDDIDADEEEYDEDGDEIVSEEEEDKTKLKSGKKKSLFKKKTIDFN